MKSKDGSYSVEVIQTGEKTWKLEADSFGTKLKSEESFKRESDAEKAAKDVAEGKRTMEWIVRKS